MARKLVFDTYAILALLEDEPGAQTVAEIISNEEAEIYMSIISLGEAYYILLRRQGERAAEEMVRNTLMEESITFAEVPWPRVKEAARIKAKGGLSYADAFVLGLAREIKAPVVTGDPEIQAVSGGLGIDVVWVGVKAPENTQNGDSV
ncbi:MAG: type II toxin-antitoxin system VapC family toxin [Bacillota bacterium]